MFPNKTEFGSQNSGVKKRKKGRGQGAEGKTTHITAGVLNPTFIRCSAQNLYAPEWLLISEFFSDKSKRLLLAVKN
jgi:hypothetical protein